MTRRLRTVLEVMLKGLRNGLVAAGLLASLSGCEHMPFAELPDEQSSSGGGAASRAVASGMQAEEAGQNVRALLAYYQGLQEAPMNDLERQALHLSSRVTAGVCDTERLQYAMVAVTMHPPEDRSFEKLLGPCVDATRGAPSSLKYLAYLLEELWRAKAVSRDYSAKLGAAQEALENQKAETAKLRKQLEGLKQIEQSIQQRDKDKEASGGQ